MEFEARPMELDDSDEEMAPEQIDPVDDFDAARKGCDFDWRHYLFADNGDGSRFALGCIFKYDPPGQQEWLHRLDRYTIAGATKQIAPQLVEALTHLPLIPCPVYMSPLILSTFYEVQNTVVDAFLCLKLLRTIRHVIVFQAEDGQHLIDREHFEQRRNAVEENYKELLHSLADNASKTWQEAVTPEQQEDFLTRLTLDVIRATEYNLIQYMNLPPQMRLGMLTPAPLHQDRVTPLGLSDMSPSAQKTMQQHCERYLGLPEGSLVRGYISAAQLQRQMNKLKN